MPFGWFIGGDVASSILSQTYMSNRILTHHTHTHSLYLSISSSPPSISLPLSLPLSPRYGSPVLRTLYADIDNRSVDSRVDDVVFVMWLLPYIGKRR